MLQPKSECPVIKIKNLKKSFGDNHVLSGFDLELFEGENLVVMGKSGSGKSVMIKCIVGLEEPDAGTITVFGNDTNCLSEEKLDELRTEVGFLFQGSALYDSMTVRQNLEFPLRRHVKKFGKIKNTTRLVKEALESVGLSETMNLMPEALSGGMKRRVALARTLILRPKIILYDEPTTGLDPITAREITALMLSVQKKYNTSAIIITHDIECARMVSDRMVLLIDGINYAEGTFEKLASSTDMAVAAFFK